MVWTTNPTRREDLPVEVRDVLDGSGNYVGPWIESSEIYQLRVAWSANTGAPTVAVEEGIFDAALSDPKLIRSQSFVVGGSLMGFGEFSLTARYFRLTVAGGTAGNPFNLTARAV